MKLKRLVTLFVLIYNSAFTQNLVGTITDSETNEKLSYVNIGVIGKAVGTISDFDGVYSFTLDPKYDSDSVRISLIGYQSQTYKISSFKKIHESGKTSFSLKKVGYNLNEIVVKPKNIKTKLVGHYFDNPKVILGLLTDKTGYEIAAYISMKKRNAYIDEININIAKSEFDSILFRINIYDVKDGSPNQIILKEPIYVTTKQKSGLLTVDVRKYNINVTNDYYVGLQWISKSSPKNLLFCAGLSGKCKIRNTCEDEWGDMPIIGLGINCKISYEVK